MASLKKVSITFNTHNQNPLIFGSNAIIHVFIKNRSNTSADPAVNTDFIGNLKAYERHIGLGDTEINPYLAYAKGLSVAPGTLSPLSNTFDLQLLPTTIKLEDIMLPVVNIHFFPNGDGRWTFDYTIEFLFDDGRCFTSSSNVNGVKGIILDQDNRNYSGICVENPFITIPPPVKPVTNALLKRVILDFGTHNDDKVISTGLNVHIVNRINQTTSQDIAIGLDMFKGQAFPAPGTPNATSKKTFIWSADAQHPLASNSIRLQDMVLPVVYIIMVPNGNDRWIFDYRITFEFDNGQTYTSRTNGIILDKNNNKHAGVYNGDSFPTVTPPTKPATTHAPLQQTKYISFTFLQQKLDEFVNNRQGSVTSVNPPMIKFNFNNSGRYSEDILPESFIDLQSINAKCGGIEYISSPSSLGQINASSSFTDLYFSSINSKSLTLNIDRSTPAPLLTLKIDFDCSGSEETVGGSSTSVTGMNFLSFSISLRLTLSYDNVHSKIDVMSWQSDIDSMLFTENPAYQFDVDSHPYLANGHFLGKAIVDQPTNGKGDFISQIVIVNLVTSSSFDPGDTFASEMTGKIYQKLTTPDGITQRTVRDDINSTVNSLLLGGVVDDQDALGVNNHNNNVVHSLQVQGDNLVITYSGPSNTFTSPAPTDWPNATTNPDSSIDFSPGKLINIDHIVVLTMENRSFDHILGYLSLPVNKGGMARTDVDGLKGGEFNPYKGINKPSFPLTSTCFSPDPPHGYEPVHQAINGGRMDGFVKSYGDEHGDAEAGNIMGYHTGANVPVYDALVRDFAFSHRWFASHPGPTFCNRFYELSGRLNVDAKGFWEFDNSSHKRPAFTETIFDYLTQYQHITSGLTWKYFEHSYCFLRFFEKYTFDNTDIVNINDAEHGFFACAKNGTLPSVSYIDPHYIEFPPNANCDGPPADIQYGQQLVQKIVEAVVTSPNWSKTLLIITYDEHGGFYDHVPPPPAAKVSPESPINTYGVRVPAFFISPWVNQGQVLGHDATAKATSLYFDHTSILKTIAKRFMTDYPPYMGARYAAANDLSNILGDDMRQSQFLPFIRYNIVYNTTQKSLDVKGGNTAPGTVLWQYNVNDTEAQHFSFEDAGDGFFYIRTHRGNLYLTADVPPLVVIGAPDAALTGAVPDYGIKQDVKYNNVHPVPGLNPAYQKWKLSPAGPVLLANNTSFVINNAFFTNKVLQPVSNLSGAAVILGDPDPANTNIINKNTWKISSPLINYQPVFIKE